MCNKNIITSAICYMWGTSKLEALTLTLLVFQSQNSCNKISTKLHRLQSNLAKAVSTSWWNPPLGPPFSILVLLNNCGHCHCVTVIAFHRVATMEYLQRNYSETAKSENEKLF